MRPRPGGRILSEPDAAGHVREMFSRIAPRYDLLNHLLSFSLDRVWRWRVARRFGELLSRDGSRVVDLCCGTGDLALALARQSRGGLSRDCPAQIFACDFAPPMLALAAEKTWRRGARIHLAHADALELPFPDGQFDLAVSAFGFRNLANYERGVREIFRVLKPGGEVAILEFGAPHVPIMAPLYRFYFKHILPRVGGAISGSSAAYAYLPASVAKFPSHEELAALMTRCGFVDARYRRWTAGIVALHTGRRE